MSAVVTETRRTVEVTVSYAVSGAEPMRADYSARVFAPDRVTLTDRDGDVGYRVNGAVPKKDGTPSLNRAQHRSYRRAALAAEPEWLQNLVRDYCAEAGIELP